MAVISKPNVSLPSRNALDKHFNAYMHICVLL